MRYIFLTVFLILSVEINAQAEYVVIKDVNIFTGSEYIENTNLVFEKGVIKNIAKEIKIPPYAIVVDGADYTIVPPLVNAHVHIWGPLNLKDALEVGIFANMDMHTTDYFAAQNRLYNDSLYYSRYYSANSGLTVPGGHGTQFGIEVPTVNDTMDARTFVQNRVMAKADFIKILKEPFMSTVSREQTADAIDEAHKLGKMVVSHVSKLENAVELTEQGVDGFAHIWWDAHATDAELDSMLAADVFMIPTLAVTEKALEMGEEQGWAEHYLPFEELIDELGRIHSLGIPILCGTDSPNFMLNYTDAIFKEMELLSKAGLSNEEVLQSATTNIYKAFKMEGFSELKEGASASFLIVKGNPVKNISDIKNEKKIFKQGVQLY